MFSQYLSSIEGIEIYPLIGMILFVLVFIGMIIRIMKMDKKHVLKMSNLPLEENINMSITKEIKNESE